LFEQKDTNQISNENRENFHIFDQVDCKKSNLSDEVNEIKVASDQNFKIDKLTRTNLFVSDCLNTYKNKRHEIKYKYHMYGGNYRQLPGYTANLFDSNGSCKSMLDLPELFYEIDAEDQQKYSVNLK
jgi:hypothetical protein